MNESCSPSVLRKKRYLLVIQVFCLASLMMPTPTSVWRTLSEDGCNCADVHTGEKRGMQPIGSSKHRNQTQFLILIGLEGTGHHMFENLHKGSPAFLRLKKWNALPALRKLQRSLFLDKDLKSTLFGARCAGADAEAVPEIFQQVVHNLKTLDTHVREHSDQEQIDTVTTVPINAAPESRNGYGMLSYPNFSDRHGCEKFFKFPDVGLLYDACEAAGVTCEHVYLYRNPYSVIKSTVLHRHFHETILEGLVMYTTMLHEIHAQLLDYGQEHTYACWNYDNVDEATAWKVGQAMGWTNRGDFMAYFESKFSPRHPMNATKQAEIVSPLASVYMDKMIRAHDRAIEACENMLE